jgi:hypothetical protein
MDLARTLRHDIGPAVYDEAHRLRSNLAKFGATTGVRRWATASWLRYTRSAAGTNVLDRDWDVLVILDACRYDEFARVASDYEFITALDANVSTGSTTYEWGPSVFGRDAAKAGGLGYVTANPYSNQFADADDLAHLDEVWRYAWDSDWGSVPAEVVTDRAIAAERADAADRLIVHYLQPHAPFVDTAAGGGDTSVTGFQGGEATGLEAAQRGDVSHEAVIEGYRRTLRYVLDSVALLCENLDAGTVVVSADHGELLGEWGLYEHPAALRVEPLIRVPWATVAAADERTHDPAEYDRGTDGLSIDDRLSALGYR